MAENMRASSDTSDDPAVHTSYAGWWWILGVPGIATLAVLLSSVRFQGPYKWTAGLIYDVSGGYAPPLAFALTCLWTWPIAYVFAFALRIAGLFAGIPLPGEEEKKRASARFEAIREVYGAFLIAFGVLAGGVLVTASELWATRNLQTRVLDASRDIGSLPVGAGVRVTGRLVPQDAVEVSEYGTSIYVPLVGEGASGERAYNVFLRVLAQEELAPLMATQSFEGRVVDSLPGLAQLTLERRGRRVTNDLVFELGQATEADAMFVQAALLACLLGLVILALVLLRARAHKAADLAERFDAIEREIAASAPSMEGAGNPGHMKVSRAKLRKLRPDLFRYDDASALGRLLLRLAFVRRKASDERLGLDQVFMWGDARAAVVLEADSERALVAAYSDEVDAAVVLRFPGDIALRERWRPGDRLLAVFSYGMFPLAEDIVEGPNTTGQFGNCLPNIAELYSNDSDRIAACKANIAEEEWTRAATLGEAYVERNAHRPKPFRDGLFACGRPWSA